MQENAKLVLVIPSVLELAPDGIKVDRDFASNLAAYLQNFERVEVFCPLAEGVGAFPAIVDPTTISGSERLDLHILPKPYREDRYFRGRAAVKRQLSAALTRARYRLISPHAPLCWSSLAGEICVANRLPFNFEADWDLAATGRYIVEQMPPGLRRIRHRFRLELYLIQYRRLLRKSTLALVQGRDVYEAYKDLAPNVHSVLNVQITAQDRIASSELAEKLAIIRRGDALKIVYAGRASQMKGPLHWLETLRQLRAAGVDFQATWLGDGEMLEEMRTIISEHGLSGCCDLPGSVPKSAVLRHLRNAHLFLFCHMGSESPRNLMEAVASGAPLCGFGTPYSRSLVEVCGGGAFVKRGDTAALARTVAALDADRSKLAALVQSCAKSGAELDRDKAIAERINLIKRHL